MNETAAVTGLKPPALSLLARRVLIIQAVLGAATSLVFSAIGGTASGLSALAGVLCAFIPNAVFFLILHGSRSQGGQDFLRSFRRGEGLKMLLTIFLFAIVLILRLPDLKALPLFAGFAVVLLGHWVSLLPGLAREARHGS